MTDLISDDLHEKIGDIKNMSTRGLVTLGKFHLPEKDCLPLAALRSCDIL